MTKSLEKKKLVKYLAYLKYSIRKIFANRDFLPKNRHSNKG